MTHVLERRKDSSAPGCFNTFKKHHSDTNMCFNANRRRYPQTMFQHRLLVLFETRICSVQSCWALFLGLIKISNRFRQIAGLRFAQHKQYVTRIHAYVFGALSWFDYERTMCSGDMLARECLLCVPKLLFDNQYIHIAYAVHMRVYVLRIMCVRMWVYIYIYIYTVCIAKPTDGRVFR
jgi:hypothetical protein